MRMRAIGLSLMLAAALPAAAETYTIDPNHSQARFQYSHFGFSNIVGLLGSIEGTVIYDPAAPEQASVTAKIPLDSVLTGVGKLDEHLKSADFFGIAEHPVASFESRKVTAAGDGKLHVEGELTLHGIGKPVVLTVELNKLGKHPMSGAPAIGFDATTQVKRSDFGVDKYAPNVSDEVQIEITVEAKAAKPE